MDEFFVPKIENGQSLPPSEEQLLAAESVQERACIGENCSADLMKDPALRRIERTGIPKELADSQRDVKMMKYEKALKYYDRLVGHEEKSFGWIITTEVFGIKVNVNIVMACLLKELEARCKAMGMTDLKFKSLSGYTVKGGFHDYGMAIDFDANDNWPAKPKQTKYNLPMAMVNELQKMGFKWGMYFNTGRHDGTTDPMHFEYRGTVDDAIAQLKSPEARKIAAEYVLPKWRFGGQTLHQYATKDKKSTSRG
jgi:hypothetical protein